MGYPSKAGNIEAQFVAPNSFIFQDAAGAHPCSSFNSLVFEKIGSRNVWEKTSVTFPTGEFTHLEKLRERYLEKSAVEEEEYWDDEG